MSEFFRSLRRIPYWAYLFVLLVIAVNTIYLVCQYKAARSGEHFSLNNGFYIIDFIGEDTPVGRTAIKLGDTLVSCNGISIPEWTSFYHGQVAGDTLMFGILRNNIEVSIPVIEDSALSQGAGFTWASFIISLLISIASLFLMIRRPEAREVKLFFIYLQLLAIVTASPYFLPFPHLLPVFANSVFIVAASFYSIVLIHFHLIFPRRALILEKFRFFPLVFYGTGIVISVYTLIINSAKVYFPSAEMEIRLYETLQLGLYSSTTFFAIALAIALYQYLTIKNTLARNQLLLLLTGSFFIFLPGLGLTLFFDWINSEAWPFTLPVASAVGNLILVSCILIALFRYRIWNVEIFIRKALLYLFATVVIIVTYFLLIWIVDRWVIRETNFTRFLIVAISVIVFLVLRDRIQRMIDRLFHREAYDSATVVSDFEGSLAGIYQPGLLKQRIVQGMDEIFHFKSFVFSLKKGDLIYQPAFVIGTDPEMVNQEYPITRELEERLLMAKVFSPQELNMIPPFPEFSHGELIVPLISAGQPEGFFICGRKKSERIYSQQDIRVLSLLARRVVAMLHTANLYQKDLDRQMMLERERIRISQDMHDDVGASLTRISILSEIAKNNPETSGEARQRLEQISETSRGVMEEMSQIIWALNPKNDTLAGLVAYIRRFVNEYLEPTSVNCSFDLPERIPNMALSVEVRRNIYLVVREALHNVVKHSGASEVVIALTPFTSPGESTTSPRNPSPKSMTSSPGPRSLVERVNFGVRLSIRDNGRGFNPENLELPGNGLVNMRRRIEDIGGEFRIISSPGAGTVAEIHVRTK